MGTQPNAFSSRNKDPAYHSRASQSHTNIVELKGLIAQWVVVLGILLAASLLANVFLLVAR